MTSSADIHGDATGNRGLRENLVVVAFLKSMQHRQYRRARAQEALKNSEAGVARPRACGCGLGRPGSCAAAARAHPRPGRAAGAFGARPRRESPRRVRAHPRGRGSGPPAHARTGVGGGNAARRRALGSRGLRLVPVRGGRI